MTRPPVPAEVGDVLVVELLGGIGDVLLFLPVIDALARRYPGARLTVCTFGPGVPLVEAHPDVAEVLVVEPGPPERVTRCLADRLAGRRFDLGVSDTRYGAVPDVVEALCGAAVTDLWRSPPPDQHITERFLELLVDDGVLRPEDADPLPRLVVSDEDRLAGARAVEGAVVGAGRDSGGPLVALVPDAGMSIKEWGTERFIALALALLGRGVVPVLTTCPDPRRAQAVARAVPMAAVLPPLTLAELAGAFTRFEACVAADTGPARLAAAAGTPTVALFGPTFSTRFGLGPGNTDLDAPVACDERNPLDMTTQACWWSGSCVHPGRATCTHDITVEDVLARLDRLVGPRRWVRLEAPRARSA